MLSLPRIPLVDRVPSTPCPFTFSHCTGRSRLSFSTEGLDQSFFLQPAYMAFASLAPSSIVPFTYPRTCSTNFSLANFINPMEFFDYSFVILASAIATHLIHLLFPRQLIEAPMIPLASQNDRNSPINAQWARSPIFLRALTLRFPHIGSCVQMEKSPSQTNRPAIRLGTTPLVHLPSDSFGY